MSRQCGCCWLPYRGAATRAYVVEAGGLMARLVCPGCARKATLLCAPPQNRGERPGAVVDLGELVPAVWCRLCCDARGGPWEVVELARPLAHHVRHNGVELSTGSPGTRLCVCEECAKQLRATGTVTDPTTRTIDPT